MAFHSQYDFIKFLRQQGAASAKLARARALSSSVCGGLVKIFYEGGRRREGWINVELCFGNLKNCPVPFLFPGQILIHFGYLALTCR
ncbi:hypothetical protein T01_7282 [Trichinella spiralis]|uniref:Uncharacterized protein n=1 Tax=Trichinella spiralis TaxID=6334 RepID=A0A0V1AZS6_TRISP|nr:hypothetical protein T01_7282 [Trichinella spiralis]